MPLKVGQKAPDFELPSTGNAAFRLSRDAGDEPVILYFYPKDFTPGCTKESCEFRDRFNFFQEHNIRVIGISTDAIELHEKFKERYQLPFDLLSDSDGSVSKLYHAKLPLVNISRRVSYLLDRDHLITAVFSDLFAEGQKHVEEMIRSVSR